MDAADSECYGPSIEALGSLFKLPQVFLWDDGAQVSSSAERSRKGQPKGKRKGKCSHQNPVEEALSRGKLEEVVSPHIYYDNASDSLSFISMLGEDNSQCVSGEGDNAAIYTVFLSDVIREQNDDDKNEDVTDGAQDGDLLVRNTFLSDDLKAASSSPVGSSSGGEGGLTVSGVNLCGIKDGEQLIDQKGLEVSSIVCKDIGHETFCNGDSVILQPMTHESDSFPTSSEGTGCEKIADSSDSGELEEWMVYWDTFYERNYFYNIRTQDSTWHPSPGMEHLAIGGCTEIGNGATVEAKRSMFLRTRLTPMRKL